MLRDQNRNGIFEDQEIFYYTKDALGSTRDLTDNQGNIVQRYRYSAYGKTTVEKIDSETNHEFIENVFAYTGREWDQETDLYGYRLRYYSPDLGRFISEDPIGFASGDTNFYRYVSNNPLRFTDPSGHFGVVGASAGFFSGAVGGYITGGLMGAAIGGVVGAGVGFVAPWESSFAGASAAGFVASVLGQGLGNVVADKPISSIDPVVAVASGLGGAAGAELAVGLGWGANATAVFSGVTGGVTELGANVISPGAMNWSNVYDAISRRQSNACGGGK